MDSEHDRACDEQAVGDVEIRPGVLAVSAQDPVTDASGMGAWQAMEVQTIVEIPENASSDESQGDRQPHRFAGLEAKQPHGKSDDGRDRYACEEPAVALAKSEHSTLVDCRLDAEIVFDPPGGRLLTGQPFPGKDFLFGQQIDAGPKESQNAED